MTFIEKNKDKPFLCFVPFTTPHSPWAAPEQDWARFKNKPITQTATQPGQEVADQTRCALAMMENQDANVGRVLAKLREHKLEENTNILYFSDNGPNSMRWTGGMKGRKGTTDEGGVRSVCYLRWPAKLPAGHTVPQIAGAIDLLPTLTALAGVPRVGDKPLDGRDLSPLLLKQESPWPERMIFSTWSGNVSVRSQTHRFDNAGRLFDMIADPGQTTPINDQHPALAAKLADAIKDWRQDMFSAAGSAKPRGGGNAVDPRPIPVGYREFPITMLPARDGEPRGGVPPRSTSLMKSFLVERTPAAVRCAPRRPDCRHLGRED
jgi:arylsulfatase A-like enzyme